MTSVQALVFDECSDRIRYVIMRFIRLAIAMVCRVYCVMLLGYSFRQMVSFGNWWAFPITPWHTAWMNQTCPGHNDLCIPPDHWFAVGATMFALCVACFSINVAFGLPYRYQSERPGLNLSSCGKCGVAVADEWMCSSCDSFRWSRLFIMGTDGASKMITYTFVAWDVIGYLAGLLIFIL